MTEDRVVHPYRLQDAPRIVCVDTPESNEELLRYAWRLTNRAWDDMHDTITDDRDSGRCEPLNRDGFHTLLVHCLLQMQQDGIEAIMNDVEHHQAWP